ncbi:zinc-ribbon domain-containing protein [Albidovulum sediminicola]|uniref:Zinc-ribbon domain-containing protein n=1 Tax=Albidovulum sediminicola TaxID=2984331 RepID=A0ABT2Z4K0_9RHOB|nr:zinc-ribbon domain-containing protein [Defluviimonas sp. WL0075]MCV2866070.1 zinc-ribbon domain-containing protein [Defluviimonas sp. WL0075]
MRLVCPKCGAQYEIEDSLIPAAGRDVQCSDCGTAWFQKSAAALTAEAEASRAAMEWSESTDLAGASDAPAQEPRASEPEEIPSSEPEPAPALAAAVQAEPDPQPAEPEPQAEAPAAEPVFKRRAIDEATLSVLREEAERETQARVAEGTATAPAVPHHEPAPERSMDIRAAEEAQPEPAAEPAPALVVEAAVDGAEEDDRQSRKELLPDIEQINSTLRSTSGRADDAVLKDAPQNLRRHRGAFRFGLISALAAVATLVLLYALAPAIVGAFPGSEDRMAAYVEAVDGFRRWLETVVLAAAEAMGGPDR